MEQVERRGLDYKDKMINKVMGEHEKQIPIFYTKTILNKNKKKEYESWTF